MQRAREAGRDTGEIVIAEHDGDTLRLENIIVRLPDGTPVVAAPNLVFRPGESVLAGGDVGDGEIDAVSRDFRDLALSARVSCTSQPGAS